MHFTSKGPLLSHRRMSEIDKALVGQAVKRNAEKNVTGAEPVWGLIDLVDGIDFALAVKKLGILLSGVTFILKRRLLSPLAMHTLLGHFTWFFLLARSSLSCFNEVYRVLRPIGYFSISN